MGWFSGLCSAVSSVVKKAVQVVENVTTKVARAAGEALKWIADKGEKVISTVKTVWPKIKPYIELAAKNVKKACMAVGTVLNAFFPGALAISAKVGTFLEKALNKLLSLENSPILKSIDAWCQKFIPKLSKVGDMLLSYAELMEARRYQKEFENHAKTLNAEEKKASMVVEVVNQFLIVKTEVHDAMQDSIFEDLDQYLQLRTAQLLLEKMERKLCGNVQIDEISDDDLFIMQIPSILLGKNPQLNEADALRLENIVQKNFHKGIDALVFGEMAQMWAAELRHDLKTQADLRDELSKKETALKRMDRMKKIDPDFSAADETQRKIMETDMLETSHKYDALGTEIICRRTYVEATEGLLRAKEESLGEIVESEYLEAVQLEIPALSDLLILCMQKSTKWEDLTNDDKMLLQDFANIFRKASQDRAKQMEAEEPQLVEVGV